MVKGFGTPKTKERKYWLQVVYEDGRDDVWYESFHGYRKTFNKAASLVGSIKDINHVLILDPYIERGEVARERHIRADLQSEYREGCKQL